MKGWMLALAAALGLAASGASANEALGVNSFAGAATLPMLVGSHEGIFAKNGLDVTLSHPKGSVDQFKGLAEGRYQVLLTALDNVVAYDDGHGEADLGGKLDLVGVMGLDGGFLTLTAAPGTKRIADLKGKVMAVDALTTGYSFALQDLLARGGVAKDAVTYITVGSSGARSQALIDGKAQAALLSMPFDVDAQDKGFVALGDVARTLGHYQASVGAVSAAWAKTHKPTLLAFIRGYRQSVAWAAAPTNKAAAIDILHQELPTLSPAMLDRVYGRLVDKKGGMSRTLAVDPIGAATVLKLRARYAAPAARPARDWHHYVDLSYVAAAR